MTLLLKFQLFVWAVILIETGQTLLMFWLFWPRLCSSLLHIFQPLQRKIHCIWCWQALHIRQWYPESWSSTMCLHHSQVMHQRLAVRIAARRIIAQQIQAEREQLAAKWAAEHFFAQTQPTITAIEAVSANTIEELEVLA